MKPVKCNRFQSDNFHHAVLPEDKAARVFCANYETTFAAFGESQHHMGMQQTGRLLASSALAFLMGLNAAHSAASEVPFEASVQSTCTIAVQVPGTLAQNPNARRLSSTQAGGVHAKVQVTATSRNFDLAADPPTAFDTQPSGYSGIPTFETAIRSFGATYFPWSNTSQPLDAGVSDVQVRLVAISDSSSSFPDGNYSATVQLRCE